MQKFFAFISLLFLSLGASASDFVLSTGVGMPYGGAGFQIAALNKFGKFYSGLGIPGVSLGFQRPLMNNGKRSWSIIVAKHSRLFEEDVRMLALTYNHHLNGYNHDGWSVGGGMVYYKQYDYPTLYSPSNSKKIKEGRESIRLILDIGYTF